MASSSASGKTTATRRAKRPTAGRHLPSWLKSSLQTARNICVQSVLAADMNSVTSPMAQQDVTTSTSSLKGAEGTMMAMGMPPPSCAETTVFQPSL